MLNLTLTLKSIWRERWLFGLWILSLAMAVTGLLIVDVFRHSLTQTLKLQGQKVLTADVSVSARHPFSDADIGKFNQALPGPTGLTRVTEMYAMVSHSSTDRRATHLSSVRFIEDGYPLLGDLLIDSGKERKLLHGRDFLGLPQAWVVPDLLTLLNVKLGDAIKIGEVEFVLAGLVRKDSSQTFRIGTMAPRIYVHRQFLSGTKLVQFGSTFSDTLLAQLAAPSPGLKSSVEKAFADPTIQVTIPEDLEQGTFRVLSRLLDFLGLSGLVTLCLGWIAVYYLGRRWLSLEAPTIGMLKCLGLSARELRALMLQKLGLIMLVGVTLGAALAWLGAHAVLPMVKDSLPGEFQLVWSWPSTLLLLLVGPISGLLLMWPALRAVAGDSPLSLIQGLFSFRTSSLDFIGFALSTAGLFFILTLVQARSWSVTFIFLGALLGTVALVVVVALGLLHVLERVRMRSWLWQAQLTLAMWSRRKSLAILMIAVSALAGMLSQLIPNIEKTLVGELQSPWQGDRPSLFMIDIQDDQVPDLQSFLASNQIEVSQLAPFIRAKILQVNGQNFERAQGKSWTTREEETDARFRNRGINLSFRTELGPAEKILSGKPWAQLSHEFNRAEISVEDGYAQRLNLKLGDTLKFDLQGLELNAVIANLREVNWNSFEPNFFILFPSGVLDDAPKTWILTLRRNSHLSPSQIQALLAVPFPNITSINVQEALDNASEVLEKLSGGLKIASTLCLILGIFVFLMILLFQMASSQRDWVQLKVLGATQREVLVLQVMSFGGLCLFGLLLGSFMSVGVSGALARFAFTTRLMIDWSKMLQILVVSSGLAGAGMIALALLYRRRASLNTLLAES